MSHTGKRILILSASVGGGHVRAAQAVELALRQIAPDATIRNTDVLSLTNPAFRRLYARTYLDLVNMAPHVLGYMYDLLDRPRPPKSRHDGLVLMVEKLNLRKFSDLLKDQHWDVIVNTHFLPAEIIASLRRKGQILTPHITVTTDFDTHRLWVNQPCNHYTTATGEGKAYLGSWGLQPENITVTGIPIDPVFCQPTDRAHCLAQLGIAGDRPVVLQLAGGFGVGPIEKLYRGLLALRRDVEIVVIAGKNPKLQKALADLPVPSRHRAHVLGFVDNMDQYLAVADIVLTKPGGLTTSEILARGAVMAIVNPIPGQESRNSDYLLEHGAAVKINNLAMLSYKLEPLLADPHRLANLKASALRLARPRAAFDIAQLALQWA